MEGSFDDKSYVYPQSPTSTSPTTKQQDKETTITVSDKKKKGESQLQSMPGAVLAALKHAGERKKQQACSI